MTASTFGWSHFVENTLLLQKRGTMENMYVYAIFTMFYNT